MKNLTFILIVSMTAFGCTRSGADTSSNTVTASTTLSLIQNKWLIDSLIVYPPSGLSSTAIYAISTSPAQYGDFRTDGNVYSYGGGPVVSYDTSKYLLLPDNKTFLVYMMTNGIASTKADTGHIIKLTANAFVYYNINAGGDYGKWILKR